MAPELALDFDMPHMSSREALTTWLIGFGSFAVFFQFLKVVFDPEIDNPAVGHEVTMMVDQDHGNVGVTKPVN